MKKPSNPIKESLMQAGIVVAIAFVGLVGYGLLTDCEPSPGIYLKHCPLG